MKQIKEILLTKWDLRFNENTGTYEKVYISETKSQKKFDINDHYIECFPILWPDGFQFEDVKEKYDERGNIVGLSYNYDTGAGEQMYYNESREYDSQNRLTHLFSKSEGEISIFRPRIEKERGEQRYEYDDKGRKTLEIIDNVNHDNCVYEHTNKGYAYDEEGNCIEEYMNGCLYIKRFFSNGKLKREDFFEPGDDSLTVQHSKVYEYNDAGKLVSVIDEEAGEKQTLTYQDGELVKEVKSYYKDILFSNDEPIVDFLYKEINDVIGDEDKYVFHDYVKQCLVEETCSHKDTARETVITIRPCLYENRKDVIPESDNVRKAIEEDTHSDKDDNDFWNDDDFMFDDTPMATREIDPNEGAWTFVKDEFVGSVVWTRKDEGGSHELKKMVFESNSEGKYTSIVITEEGSEVYDAKIEWSGECIVKSEIHSPKENYIEEREYIYY